MQVEILYTVIGQTDTGIEVLGSYYQTSDALRAVQDFGYRNPFTNFHVQVAAVGAPHISGNTLEIAWDDLEWVWA